MVQEWGVGEYERRAGILVDPLGNEMAVHVGPCIRDLACPEARDPRAEHQLEEQGAEREHAPAGEMRRAGYRFLVDGAEVERGPDQRGEEEQRHQQVCREAVWADFGTGALEP